MVRRAPHESRMQFRPGLEALTPHDEFIITCGQLPDPVGPRSGFGFECHQFAIFRRALEIEHSADGGYRSAIGRMNRHVGNALAIEIDLAAVAQARDVLFAGLDHGWPRSSCFIEISSRASAGFMPYSFVTKLY